MADRLTKADHSTAHDKKTDPLVTWAFQAWDSVQGNLRNVAIGIGVVILAVLAVSWYGRAQARAEGDANRILAEASANYWQGNYARTIQLTDQVMEGFKTTKAANDARRMKADCLFWQGSFDSAATLYTEYLSKDRTDTPIRFAVQQSLAFALESKGDAAAAAKLYEEIAPKAPDTNSQADFWMAAARAYRGANQPDKARPIYEKVANEFKDTPFARDAEVYLGELMAGAGGTNPVPAAGTTKP